MNEPTIFYSWQSDTDQDLNHRFIASCLKEAAVVATESAGLPNGIVIESDTTGVGGTPSIPETIFQRIDSCAVFIADMTLVAESRPKAGTKAEECQKHPNANVILELGYAVKSIGWKRVLGVMNTVYGNPDKQIFHLLQHRWPLKYALDDESKIKAAGRDVIDELSHYIGVVLKAEHAEAERIQRRLNVECLKLMDLVKGSEYFSHASLAQIQDARARQEAEAIFPGTVTRLLDLGVIRSEHDWKHSTYAYHWTYIGNIIRAGFK